MSVIHLDTETSSKVDPKKYSFDHLAKFCALDVVTWAVAPDFYNMPTEVHVWDVRANPTPPTELIALLNDPTNWFIAFNSGFDEIVIQTTLGIHLPNNWLDSGTAASRIGYSVGALKDIAKVLKCKHQKVELYPGLMKLFSTDKLYGNAKTYRGRALYLKDGSVDLDYYHELRRAYIDYAIADTWVSAEIFVKCMTQYGEPYPIEDWLLHQRMNQRGIGVDMAFVDRMIALNAQLKEHSKAELRKMCGADYEVASNPGFAKWLSEKLEGWDEGSSGKVILPLAAEREYEFGENDLIAKACRLKASALGTSNAKFPKLKATANADGRLYATLRFNGAATTGRPTGSGVQMLNLPRPFSPKGTKYPVKKSSDAHAMSFMNAAQWVERYGYQAADVAAKTIRAAFIPRDGYKFIDFDFSSIENVAVVNMTQDPVGLDIRANKRDAYVAFASRQTGLSYEEIMEDKANGGTIRQDYKPPVLGGNYGMSGPTLLTYAQGMGVYKPLGFWVNAMNTWRETHVGVVQSWKTLEMLFHAITESPAGTVIPIASEMSHFPSVLERHANAVVIRHPCGRGIWFREPKMQWTRVPYVDKATGEQAYFDAYSMTYLNNQGAKEWRESSYGGKLLGILTQSLCNSLLRDWIKNIEAYNIPIVLQVYDQVLAEVPEQHVEWANEVITHCVPGTKDPSHWSASWDVGIDGGVLDRFWK